MRSIGVAVLGLLLMFVGFLSLFLYPINLHGTTFEYYGTYLAFLSEIAFGGVFTIYGAWPQKPRA